jgi:DNA-binding transcriptional MerR regulator
MLISELARRAGVSVKAVRYYESVGLLDAARLANGYRDYDESHVRFVREVRELAALGIRVEQARPFLDCLIAGNGQGDDCPDSIAAYRAALGDLDGRIAELTTRREALALALDEALNRDPAQPLCAFSPRPIPRLDLP